ncbi:hypothetical protein U0355_05805 [Salimicrobium sp. PL1-032A]|uniref:hypothetical protein n=1 Tax=Salimicrobium sp. PL1-032A TaxID=3095364 RepID=UPI0032618FC1
MTNDKGMALVTVLLTIVVTMLLLGTLASMILSSGAQTQRSHENIQADSLAGMGQEYITASFESEKNKVTSAMKGKETIDTFFQAWKTRASTERHLGRGKYEVTVEKTNGDPLTYRYISKGTVADQVEVITGTLSIKQEIVEKDWKEDIIDEKDDLTNVLASDDPADICEKPRNGRGNHKTETFAPGDYRVKGENCNGSSQIKDPVFEDKSRVWFDDHFTMRGGNTVTIHGFVFFDLDRLSMNGGNEIIVDGNAYISTASFIVDKMTNSSSITIKKDAYFEDPKASVIRDLNICVNGKTNVSTVPACAGG